MCYRVSYTGTNNLLITFNIADSECRNQSRRVIDLFFSRQTKVPVHWNQKVFRFDNNNFFP
jgi:hypothetical protein